MEKIGESKYAAKETLDKEQYFFRKQDTLKRFFKSKYDWEPSLSDWILLNRLIRDAINEHTFSKLKLEGMRKNGEDKTEIEEFRKAAFFSSIEKETFCRFLKERMGILDPEKFLDETPQDKIADFLKS